MTIASLQKWSISALAAASVLYGLVVLWYVPTQPSIPLGCLLTNASETPLRGLEIRDTRLLHDCRGAIPEIGDYVIEAAGNPVLSFADWARIHRALRHWKVESAAVVPFGRDPSEESAHSAIALVEYPDKSRYVRVGFLRPGSPAPQTCWLPLVPQSTLSVSMTLLWFALQSCVLVVGGVAYWNRPFDQPVRTFFALSAVTLAAFVGGSHWWIVAASPLLILIFTVAGTLLPAVILHFFLAYPFPPPFFDRSKPYSRAALYFIPSLAAATAGGMILGSWLLTQDLGAGPFARTLERLMGETAASLMPVLKKTIYVIFGIAVAYFLASLAAISRSLRAARNPVERNQVLSIYRAALFATIPITYTVYLAAADQVDFALGGSRWPMFLASLAFMLAYAIAIARYKLMLVDQVVSRGVWYYGSSAGLALVFSALIAVGAVNALHQDLSLFGQTAPLVLVFMTSILVLVWGRDALQRSLDRRFYSEKYQLDKALQRMNRVVSSVLEPEAISDSLLNSCRDVLHTEQAALYLRKGDRLEFRMSTAIGRGQAPLQLTLDPEAFTVLAVNPMLQRAPHADRPTQTLLRQLRAEVVHGLELQGKLAGLLVLGPKPNNSPFSAEDLAFISAMARISGVALHCASVQQDAARLNRDLQLKMDKIDDQERQLAALHSELAGLAKLPAPAAVEDSFRRSGIKGHSPAMTQVLETVRKVASSSSSVLLRGESGTGKELLARAIHENSPRAAGPLISVHCGALSPTLLESELFGHVKGAFTDARQDKVGRFQMADGGTLFLDEIGDISLDVQVKLLRVLQERTFEPVGSGKSMTVDVRIVAATHRNLEQLIATGQFREDLFYRLNVISITLPPLRERKDDLIELAIHFLRSASEKSGKTLLRIDDEALKTLQAHDWPGNIRELQNVIERAVVLAEGDTIHVTDLSGDVRQSGRSRAADPTHLAIHPLSEPAARPMQIALRRKTLGRESDEKAALQAALDECGGNKAEAARALGMPRSTFFSKLKKHGLGS